MNTRGQGHSLTFTEDSHSIAISNISSDANGPVVIKFYVESSGAKETKNVQRTNMAAMPVDSKLSSL